MITYETLDEIVEQKSVAQIYHKTSRVHYRTLHSSLWSDQDMHNAIVDNTGISLFNLIILFNLTRPIGIKRFTNQYNNIYPSLN